MPDENKFAKLREVRYSIPVTCGMCAHGPGPKETWAECRMHKYEHLRQTNPSGGRGVSVHASGTCPSAKADPNKNTYEVPAVKCTMETGPGCNCGKPWLYHIEDIQCPTCQYKPGFLERPIWTHIGMGMGNVQSILSLDIYRDDPQEEEGFEGPLPTVRIL